MAGTLAGSKALHYMHMVLLTSHLKTRARLLFFGQFKNMFITPLYRQHASHTLASRAYGPQLHMRSSPTAQDHYFITHHSGSRCRADFLFFITNISDRASLATSSREHNVRGHSHRLDTDFVGAPPHPEVACLAEVPAPANVSGEMERPPANGSGEMERPPAKRRRTGEFHDKSAIGDHKGR